MPKLQIFLPDGDEDSHDLEDETITVGRLSDNTIQINDISVSSHHAQLTLSGDNYHLKDLNSTNGTRVNGQTVTEKQLHNGDKIRFGKIETVYHSKIHASSEKRELPATEPVTLAPAASSSRPAGFANASPFRVKKQKKDSAGSAIFGLGVFSIVLFLIAAGYLYYALQVPQ